MLIFDYVQALENKSSQFTIQRSNVQGMQSHESNQPSLESLAKSLKLKYSKTGLIQATKDFFFKAPNVARCEDDIARYVTILKIVIRKYSPQILHQLFDAERKTFPVFEQLLQYSIHEDVMIKNAARLGLLIILKECQDYVRNYIVQYGAPQYAENMSSFLKRTILNLQDSIKKGQEHYARCAIRRFEEEIEYIDDIFRLENEVVVDKFRTTFIKQFVVPILKSIVEQNADAEKNEISLKTDLFLIGKLMQIVTDRKFKNEIIELLLPIELQETRIRHFILIFNITSIKEITKFKDKIVQKIKNIVSSMKPNLSQIYAIRILGIAIESFLYSKNYYGVFVIFTSFIDELMKYFLPETSISVFKMLDLISSVLEPIAITSQKHDDSFWLELKTNFAKILQVEYLKLCKQLKFDNIMESTTIIDRQYDDFLKNKSNFSNAFEDILYVIPNRNTDEYQENVEYREIDTTLQKLFHLRYLCLHLHQKREKILPLLCNKIRIGEKLTTENCIPCKILVGNTSTIKCFLKLTSSQILILQDNGNDKEGVVVFCSYYKDLLWRKCNETLLLKENTMTDKKIVPIMQLKLKPLSRICILSKTLTIAKQKQNDILKRKLDDLLETVYSQNESNTRKYIKN
ncbi:hypothetical protein AVEN_83397-1 [Araneus ventricosus]|uniref:Uncharacterized protein n=1 Tax=Araneus ventricosus TaxID=182803 RepID=A0A4Y2M132_ARAVE|nr:hypothetical protein AVEN_83397-1 [Araneus ventricosus]